MSNRRDDFNAGISFMIIWFLVVTVIFSYGQKSNSAVGVGDIIFFLFLMLIFAWSSIDVYLYWKRRKENPTHVIKLNSLADTELFAKILTKHVKEAKDKLK